VDLSIRPIKFIVNLTARLTVTTTQKSDYEAFFHGSGLQSLFILCCSLLRRCFSLPSALWETSAPKTSAATRQR